MLILDQITEASARSELSRTTFEIYNESEENVQETLLAALLAAHEELQEAVEQYDTLSTAAAARQQTNERDVRAEDGRDDRPELGDGRDESDDEPLDGRDDVQPFNDGRDEVQQDEARKAAAEWTPVALMGRSLNDGWGEGKEEERAPRDEEGQEGLTRMIGEFIILSSGCTTF